MSSWFSFHLSCFTVFQNQTFTHVAKYTPLYVYMFPPYLFNNQIIIKDSLPDVSYEISPVKPKRLPSSRCFWPDWSFIAYQLITLNLLTNQRKVHSWAANERLAPGNHLISRAHPGYLIRTHYQIWLDLHQIHMLMRGVWGSSSKTSINYARSVHST